MGFNEFMKSAKQAVGKATDKLDNTVEIQKIKYNIGKKQDEINEAYCALGKAIIDCDGDTTRYAAEITKASENIAKIKAEINELNKQRISKEGKIICPGCGLEVSLKDEFCSSCGAKIVKKESEKTEKCENDEKAAE